ncbi:MAG TPA: ABC transporter ATP-binding protein [Methanothrix sp.]|nr:ABC transporter ATP-binding protein [Methanothrix sp.]OPX80773.1 MAG: putative ABC transporter ATP-binding protein [Methanosaeta sp. PtaB.Bin087]OPY49319.1 MAG: putative ABC transporter ATP-binding protein [Methanosaeta sp. PtaU1.Bin055]HNR57467.1 ABC transporter ATP-binding protein [Methanothrix sp.]HNT72533.1 ABC transporter ATP-binding protein [Methanothrix sp.]
MSNIIEIKKLRKVYGDGVELLALDDVDLTIKEGEVLAIVGPSGSGKSTLLNMIGLLDTPSDGEIWLKGQNITKASPKERARLRNKELGFIFQYHHLLPEFDAVENVMMPLLIAGMDKKEARHRAITLLEEVGLGDRLHNRPNQLSGGQNQRVAVARALAGHPSIVIGDEPTGNLDSKSSDMIYELLRKLNRQMNQTFILVTHDMDMAEKTDRILRLVDGRIVCEMRRDGDGFVSQDVCRQNE